MDLRNGLWDTGDEEEKNTIPFVIDNQQFRMGDVLNTLLTQYKGQSLDIATAYFNVGGWQLLADNIGNMGSFRLLLGDEPEVGADLGLREVGAKPVKGLIKDLANASFEEKTLHLIEDLTAFLSQEHVKVRLYTKGFLHAKCYLFYSGGSFEHFNPVAAIVGSSNFTRAGLISNKELNLVHRTNLAAEEITPERLRGLVEKEERQRLSRLDETDRVVAANLPGVLAINGLAEWYEQQWNVARDFKDELLDITNLIQCHPDTLRIVPADGAVSIFDLQEKVIASILQASVEQLAVAEAPKILDPIQQTMSTILRNAIHSPVVSRKEVLTAIQRLGSPLPGVYLKVLRKAYEAFLLNKQVSELLTAVNALDVTTTSGAENSNDASEQNSDKRKALLKREDLKLICFEYVWH